MNSPHVLTPHVFIAIYCQINGRFSRQLAFIGIFNPDGFPRARENRSN
jgi:hypothetical protein